MKKTLGGDRLGAGKRMQVELHGYERSTHDMGYLWRSTMSAGTLVPFLNEVALPGDTFDINLDVDMKTHPTVGPLFGSYKIQLDIFLCPVRLYQGTLHNNKLGIGLNMAAIKLPILQLPSFQTSETTPDLDNAAINPSCILKYLGISGPGIVGATGDPEVPRVFNAIPFLAYWDIYKNYYANKQEEIGAVIHTQPEAIADNVDAVTVDGNAIAQAPTNTGYLLTNPSNLIRVTYTGGDIIPSQIMFKLSGIPGIRYIPLSEITTGLTDDGTGWQGNFNFSIYGPNTLLNWDYIATDQLPLGPPQVETFDLDEIDTMREAILGVAGDTVNAFNVNDQNLNPYQFVLTPTINGLNPRLQTQEGLAVKTYQSDLFNNWLQTEWIDGAGGISEVTAIDTSGGSFSIDTLNLSKKVYDMLNRIAVSGGSYDDWMDAVWAHDRYQRAETPIYCGGLIKELVFQEVISNAESTGETGTQPLGTLAGRGIMAKKHKGGQVTVKVDEPSYIIGIISLTPRIDYSQGNKWHTHLLTMDDFHKPALDEIGFQELITEQMAWWSTEHEAATGWTTKSAGKQPAWINYMTNVNQVYGNFAIESNEMFMTLNRKYQYGGLGDGIQDLTTYIDPVKYNNIFADTSLDAQNFWAQIAVDITARRKMSAKIMPNL